MEFSAVNTIWVLVGAALVFFMQAGFAMVETGFTRAKNAGNIIMKNLMDFASCLSDLPDCILCHSSHHCFRCHGRAYQIYFLLYLQCSDQRNRISYFRSLDLGRRLAGSVRFP